MVFVGIALLDEVDMVYGNGDFVGVDDPFADGGFKGERTLEDAMWITVLLAESNEIRNTFIRARLAGDRDGDKDILLLRRLTILARGISCSLGV